MAACAYCEAYSGTVAIVFPSEQAYRDSGMADGEDMVRGDEHATHAVWPGKNNVGRSPSNWWLCTPLHPRCGDELLPFEPDIDSQKVDWFAEIPEDEMDKYIVNPGLGVRD